MSVPYSVVSDGNISTITAIVDGEVFLADSNNANWNKIRAAVENGTDDEIRAAFDIKQAIAEKFRMVSDRVSIKGNQIYFDSDPVNIALADHIIRTLDEDVDFDHLVLFLEKLAANPSENSREQLYQFLSRHKFTIDADGDILAYKGVTSDFMSINTGYAIVDGDEYNGAIPNNIGSTVSMPRSRVEDNRDVACSFGLHAGTFSYAQGFSQGKILLVKISPTDVVSVPRDSNDQKIRCCKYTVLEEVTSEYGSPYFHDGKKLMLDDGEDDDYYDDGDDYCCEDHSYGGYYGPYSY